MGVDDHQLLGVDHVVPGQRSQGSQGSRSEGVMTSQSLSPRGSRCHTDPHNIWSQL